MSTNVDLELLLREFESTAGWDKYDMMHKLTEFVRNDKRDAEIFAMEQRIAELEEENRAHLSEINRGCDIIQEKLKRITELERYNENLNWYCDKLEAEVRELLEAGKVSEYVSDPPTAPTEGA